MIFFLEKLSTLSSSLVNKLRALGHKLRSTKANHIIASAKYSYFFSACNLCGSRNTSEPLICSACKTDLLAPLCISKCESCKLPLLGGTDQTHCPECRINPPQYDECHVVTTYEFPASNLVHRLKYQNKPFMARLIGQLLAQVRRRCDYPLPELICCVPIHPNKLREKKYNHAGEIARMTAKELALPFNSGLLAKTQQTEPQSKLSRAERLKNLENSFMVNPETNLKGMHVAVVDDVMTTGATLDLISGILKARGVRRVEVWAFARTPKPIPK